MFSLGLTAGSACACRPGESKTRAPLPEIRGAGIAHVHSLATGYGSGTTARLYDHLKKLGVTSVQFNTFAYQRELKSKTLAWNDPTLSDDLLAAEIRAARGRGFSVLLKPHVWVGGFDPDGPAVWCNQIDFEDPAERAAWFAEYGRFLRAQVSVARASGVELFAVGTELVLLSRHETEWRRLIAEIRREYDGKLTYADEAWNAPNIKFWDALDYIGLDFYYEYEGIETGGGADETRLAEFYARKLREHYDHAQTVGRPLLLTEIGFPAHDLTIRKPYAWSGKEKKPRPDLQNLGYRAFGRALRTAGAPEGMYIWKYATTLESYERENALTGFLMEKKPAENEIARIYGARD